VATVDELVRGLIEKQVAEPVLALARFHASGPESPQYWPFPLIPCRAVPFSWLPRLLRWLRWRRAVRLPRPAYLAVGESAVRVSSARFGRGTRLLGPFEVWQRCEITEATVQGDGFRVSFRPGPNRDLVDLEAVEPGPEAASVIRYLTATTAEK
jgi:hypothetical protein